MSVQKQIKDIETSIIRSEASLEQAEAELLELTKKLSSYSDITDDLQELKNMESKLLEKIENALNDSEGS